jgi:tetratricopeptide (TPR) repeat protein/TolB-like protein
LGWSLVRARQGAATSLAGVAVLPFRVTGTGQDLALYREGLVDLLSIDLEGAPGVRVLPPGTVLSRWHQDVGRDQDAVDLSVALDVARSVRARYAVLGSLVGAGSSVRVSAAIHELPGGQERGRLQVEGPSDSILRLVDRLTLQVLGTGLLQDGATGASPDLEGLTTKSLPALKAYLAGEQQLRRAQPRAALEAFQRATSADSGFARGFYRLSIAEAYVHSPHIPRMSREGYEQRALALSAQLTPREASLVRALVLTNFGDPRGIDTLRALTRARPNDAEAWFFLGDAVFHDGGVAFASREEFRQAMRKGLELDPSFALGYVHLTEDAFDRLDSAETRRLIARVHAIDSTSPKAVGLRLAWDLSWGSPAEQARARSGMDSFGVDALLTAKHAVDVTPDLWETGVATARAVVRNPAAPEQPRAQGLDGLRIIYLSRGKVRESIATFERVKEVYPGRAARWTALNRVFMVALSYADTSELHGAIQVLDTIPDYKTEFAIGAAAVRRSDWKEVERRARRLEEQAKAAETVPDSLDREFDPPRLRATAQAVRGLAAAARGDRSAAIRGLTEASAALGQDPYGEFSPGTVARVRLAELLIDAGNAREAVRYLQGFDISNSADVVAPVEFLLGRAREQLGDTAQAVQHYGKFARWWADADPELRPRVDEARTAIARLTGEPAQIPGTP